MNHTEYKGLPKIAIIGSPNVGKSSIFNRILGRRKAIIESAPGVTRDRLYAHIRLGETDFVLIDTGGIIPSPKDKIAELVYKQSRIAIDESDAVIFVCDLLSEIRYQDEHITMLLKKSGKKVFLVINKVDKESLANDVFDFYRLGLGKPYGISALHNRGFEELFKDLTKYISSIKRETKEQEILKESVKIAVVGRPNVGKSSFINSILNQERLLVDEAPGTTRDAVDVHLKKDGRLLTFIDTAGMKHKRKMRETVEIFSMARAKESVRRCDIALVMIDIVVGLCRDDIAIIDYVIEQGRPCILLINKSDLAKDIDKDGYVRALRKVLRPLQWMPIIYTSCKEKTSIIKAVELACQIAKRATLSIPTHKINELLQRLQKIKPHPAYGRLRPKIYYAVQISTTPQKFLLFVTDPRGIKAEYLRFIENHLRREFSLEGVPISFQLRAKAA